MSSTGGTTSSISGTSIYTIRTKYGTYVRVHEDTITADGDDPNSCNAQFHIQTSDLPNDLLAYHIRPVGREDKFLGVNGMRVVLQDVPRRNTSAHFDIRHSSFNFIAVRDGYSNAQSLILRSSLNFLQPQYLSVGGDLEVTVGYDRFEFWLEQVEDSCNEMTAHTLDIQYKMLTVNSECGEVDIKLDSRHIASTISYPRIASMWREELSAEHCGKKTRQRKTQCSLQ